MLLNLHVKNMALIDEMEVNFEDRLNILTGETGAGKSIIIGSINAALGKKVSKDMIRREQEYGLVELVFHIDKENTLEKLKKLDVDVEDQQVIITRKIQNDKSICKINGETVPLKKVREVADILIDIHGQQQHQSLLYEKNQLDILDQFAHEKTAPLLENIAQLHKEYTALKKELEENGLNEEERARELNFLEYQIEEIGQAQLKVGEDQELEEQFRLAANSKNIVEALSEVAGFTGSEVGNQAGSMIGAAIRNLGKISHLSEKISTYKEQLEEIDQLLSDFNRDITDYMEEVVFREDEFRELEERITFIQNLKSKYGSTIEAILEYEENAKKRYETLVDYQQYKEQLTDTLQEKLKQLTTECEKLTKVREQAAKELEEKIKEALIDLNFLDVQFKVKLMEKEAPTAKGMEEISFLIATNPGESLKPVNQVASGGELSRIMLAIKSVLADLDQIDTLIFDEIDVGVSGRTAQKVAQKLAVISKNHQILCITHLPQIAAMADTHFLIEKTANEEETTTSIYHLEEEASVNEIARLLGGVEITDLVKQNAKEMKDMAKHSKLY